MIWQDIFMCGFVTVSQTQFLMKATRWYFWFKFTGKHCAEVIIFVQQICEYLLCISKYCVAKSVQGCMLDTDRCFGTTHKFNSHSEENVRKDKKGIRAFGFPPSELLWSLRGYKCKVHQINDMQKFIGIECCLFTLSGQSFYYS